MSSRTTSRARRFAALLAILGMLALSSGAALMLTAAPAQAKPALIGVKVCHANAGNSDTDPYDYEIESVVGAVLHTLFHRLGGPNVKTWSSAGTWNGIWHDAGDPRPDYVVPLDPNFTEDWCEAPTYAPVTASVTWTEASCENGNEAGYQTLGDNVTWSVESGAATPGGSIVLEATADAGYKFPGNESSQTFSHDFDAAEDCTAYDATADITWVEPDCDNDNTASWSPTGNAFVTYAVTEGTVAPGQTVTVTATADEGHAFADESTTKEFEHTFDAEEICDITLPPVVVTPGAPTFTDPTCDIDPSMALPEPAPVIIDDVITDSRTGELIDEQNIDGVHYVVTGDLVPGGTVDVHATALEGYEIAEGATTHWTHTFTDPECSVEPPVVEPGGVVVTPTVVSSGLDEVATVVDPRGRQGLVLAVGGLVLLVLAAGFGLTPSSPKRR